MPQISRQRLKWWLRAEQALGLSHVRAAAPGAPLLQIQIEADDQLPQELPAAESGITELRTAIARSIAESSPVSAVPAVAGELIAFAAELYAGDKAAALSLLDESQVRGCTKCLLCRTRKNTVFGEGDANARVMFVGEGPGGTEDATGRPFVGRAGQKLDEMIKAMGFARAQVYICNIVKCRAYLPGPPPKDRPPQPDEAATCISYLHQQIEIVRPRVMVTLGLSAMQYLLGTKQSMSRMRGNWQSWRDIPVMPTFHPSYILRNPTIETRRAVWEDLKQVMAKLKTVA
jgi:DNA polymerase